MRVSLCAPAKINWFLKIISKRTDGYHNIMSSMHGINLYDTLMFEHGDSLYVDSDIEVPVTDNLVYRAAFNLKQRSLYKKGAKITLIKKIPVAAGLGGGSSDAAYTLLGLNILWDLRLSKKELHSIASEIGADVSFFLNGPLAMVEGRGEIVSPLATKSSFLLVLAKPPISVLTAWAYEQFDERKTSELTKIPIDIKLFCQALNKKDFAALNIMLINDLEKVVIERYPVVGEIKDKMTENGALYTAMSGSGPAVFGIFQDKAKAEKTLEALKPNWCCLVNTL
jgi:4-diphosphocytidyl-2-C-methyl-D-erythritol kinase